VAYRDQNGVLRSRTQLLQIDGFGERTFEQAAGFLRIKNGENPLDRTAVHPESYALVEKMASSLGVSVSELIENPDRIQAIDFKGFEAEAGKYTVQDIRQELLKPGRDPRDQFVAPKFRDDVKEVSDLKEGMDLEGAVTNVTNFGAFVDLGVHQDGLVHISELSHKYIQDARQAVKVGDIVKVRVIAVDPTMKRISLSIKALAPKPPRRPRRKKKVVETTTAARAPISAQAAAQSVDGQADRQPAKPRPPRRENVRPQQSTAQGKSRPERSEHTPRPAKPAVETTAPVRNQTMEEKIRALQEKFGRVG
jgi:uncharacterized protein